MTALVTLFLRSGRLWTVALWSCLALGLGTGIAQAQSGGSSNRFLFIIDASTGMKFFEKGVQDSLFDMISTGMRGKMTNGDTYGLWLLGGDEIDMSFKMETWREKFKVEMAARTALHVKEQGHRGKLDMAQSMNDVLAIVRGVGDVTLIFISNGETPMVKTPFDPAINARYQELAPTMKRKKATINTVLAAQDGKLVAWAVNSPDFPVEVPYVPPKPKPAPVVAAKSPAPQATNTAPVTAAPVTVASEAPTPARTRPNFGPIIITKDIVAQERRQFLALASTYTNEAGATPTATNPAPAPAAAITTATTANTNGLTALTNLVTVLVPNSNVAAKPAAIATTPSEKAPQTATNAPTNHTAPATVARLTKPEATNVATVTVSVSMPPASPTAALSVPANANTSRSPETHFESSPLLWVAVGAGAALVCMLSVLVVMRARRPEPSLVSQAIIRERMRAS